MDAVGPVLLMRSGILRKGLPAQWQSNIAVKLSTEVSHLLFLTTVVQLVLTARCDIMCTSHFQLASHDTMHTIAIRWGHIKAETVAMETVMSRWKK